MMDKKDSKKKRKPLNKRSSIASDKENMNSTADSANSSNVNESIMTVSLKPPRKEGECNGLFHMRSLNFYNSEYNNRKRSISLLTADDFMNDITNENYWHNLAENDRDALASALSENRDLHNRITELEDENIRLKALLDEARSLVEVLTDLLEEEEDSLDERSDDSIWDEL